MIVTDSGKLYAYEYNNYDELGLDLNKTKKVSQFTLIEKIPMVKEVVCGDGYSFVLTHEGKILGSGKFLEQSIIIL